MITIKSRTNGRFRIIITNEEWEVKNRKELDKMLKSLLDIKETFGKLNETEVTFGYKK